LGNNLAHIIYLGKSFKEWNHFKKAPIIWIVVPTKNWNRILRVEIISVWTIVDNYNIFHGAAEQRKIFDVRTLIAEAVVAEKTEWNVSVRVNGVHKRIGIDAH
jgi:hypothetical protein